MLQKRIIRMALTLSSSMMIALVALMYLRKRVMKNNMRSFYFQQNTDSLLETTFSNVPVLSELDIPPSPPDALEESTVKDLIDKNST